jgi:hypothetical protein
MDITNFYKFDGIPQEVAVVSVLREEPEVKDEKEKKVERNDFTILESSYEGDINCNNLYVYSSTVIRGNVDAEHIIIDLDVFARFKVQETPDGVSYVGDNDAVVQIVGACECADVHVG